MTTVIPSGDCGNSPKNQFVEKVTIALATQDQAFLLESVADDILWNIVGQQPSQGKAEFAAALNAANKSPVTELVIDHVMTHGKAGAVNGTRTQQGGKRYEFCDVYEFSNTKATSIRKIISYVIEKT